MKKMELWGVAAVCAVMAAACGEQSSGGGGGGTPATAPQTLLDEMNLTSRSRIEGRVAEVNIVSDDQSKVPARMADPHLLNAWGLAFFPNGPAWISANGQGTLEVYDATGKRLREVAIPPPAPMGMATPTGQVFNPDSSAFGGDKFIAASEDGAVIGWQPSNDGTAVVRKSNPDAVYKGLTIGMAQGSPHLYVADFHDSAIVAFDSAYGPATLPGSFTDPDLPANYGPFNVMAVGPFLLVSYAQQDSDKHDDVAGAGFGLIDVFTTEGFFVQRLISTGGALNSPWAMLFAPDRDRGSIDLLVGNFGDGMINVYDLSLGRRGIDAELEGPLGDRTGRPLVIPGLWALEFGSGGAGFDADKLYFTAGPNGEADGLFGSLRFVGPRR